jgi:hypothetical protein
MKSASIIFLSSLAAGLLFLGDACSTPSDDPPMTDPGGAAGATGGHSAGGAGGAGTGGTGTGGTMASGGAAAGAGNAAGSQNSAGHWMAGAGGTKQSCSNTGNTCAKCWDGGQTCLQVNDTCTEYHWNDCHAFVCAPWDAVASGDCSTKLGESWNGQDCVPLVGCSCKGASCPLALVPQACEANKNACSKPCGPGSCGHPCLVLTPPQMPPGNGVYGTCNLLGICAPGPAPSCGAGGAAGSGGGGMSGGAGDGGSAGLAGSGGGAGESGGNSGAGGGQAGSGG